jgi:hypothetical protein
VTSRLRGPSDEPGTNESGRATGVTGPARPLPSDGHAGAAAAISCGSILFWHHTTQNGVCGIGQRTAFCKLSGRVTHGRRTA